MPEKRCIGFGEFEAKCDRAAGSSHSKLWCQRCDDLRLASLDRQFKEIRRDLEHHRSPRAAPVEHTPTADCRCVDCVAYDESSPL